MIPDRLTTALQDRYTIEREIGAGGMATVYLAHDLKHNRKVAVKVLRPELSAILGGERFLKEIEVTANLQHPNILPLYDSGDAEGFLYYVMPLVEGESLRDHLTRQKQLPVDECVEIAKAVAAALDYAHRRDVVHRDIKPENVLLHDGQAIVADFGIALAVSQAGGTRLTETGLSLGTPNYMSPEQATGDRELDARSDVYSLGAVVYEMLVGEPPHIGGTIQAIIAKILTESPPSVGRSRETVPTNVDAAVQCALSKTPADRFQSAAEFAEALTNPSFTLTSEITTRPAEPAGGSWQKRLALPMAGMIVLLGALLVWSLTRPSPGPPPVSRYGLSMAENQALIDLMEFSFSLSSDGSHLVYVGEGTQDGQLWVKPRDRHQAVPLAGTDGAYQPVISPDGAWVAFAVGTEIRKIPLRGGSAIVLADSAATLYGGLTWLSDETLIYVAGDHHLRSVPSQGGASQRLWTPTLNRFAVLPVALPDGRGVGFTLCDNECGTVQDLWVFDVRSDTARRILPEVAQGWYIPTGHLIYVRREGGVFTVPFDIARLEVTGPPIHILDGIKVDGGIMPDLTVSPSGTIAMLLGASSSNVYELVWIDRAGNQTQVDPGLSFASRGGEHGWALSPDDTRLAIRTTTDAGDDIWIKEMDRGPLVRLTLHTGNEVRPHWMPDGNTVTYVLIDDDGVNLHQSRADGTMFTEPLTSFTGEVAWEAIPTPGGGSLVIRLGGSDGNRDLWLLGLGADTTLRPLAVTRFDEAAAAVSPNGQWVAYESSESGRTEVYVKSLSEDDGRKSIVSTDGGVMPAWAHSGRELFFVSADREMMAVDVETGSEFRAAPPRSLFSIGEEILMPMAEHYTIYDVSSDDRRFLLARRFEAEESTANRLVVVEHWFEELKAAVGN